MNRRGFLAGILAAGAAPAIVKAESLMKIIVPPEKKILIGTYHAMEYSHPKPGDFILSRHSDGLEYVYGNIVVEELRALLYSTAVVYNVTDLPTDGPFFRSMQAHGRLENRMITRAK